MSASSLWRSVADGLATFGGRQSSGVSDSGRRTRTIDFGDLRRIAPISTNWGFERGSPVDRFYVERFLARSAADVRGCVLEAADDGYTRRFGGDRVTAVDILHHDTANARATVIADLAQGDGIPSAAFDCVLLTQTLQYVYDLEAAVLTIDRMLKPGGVLLMTVPGLSRIDANPWDGAWLWTFTARALRRLLEQRFAPAAVEIEAHGNVLAAVALLHGLAAEELRAEELDEHDPRYPVIITARAQKSAGAEHAPAETS